jgi:ubiquinone/menaquinone biosynthesis methyltransferase
MERVHAVSASPQPPFVSGAIGSDSAPGPIAPVTEPVQQLFNQIAPAYDQLNDRLSLGMHRLWKQMTVQWARPPVGGRVLDICCGSGDLAFRLARAVGPQGDVVGLDCAAQLLAIAQQRAQCMLPQPPITWVQGDALNLPFDDNRFQSVTLGYGLRNVADILGCLREIQRVLQPTGRAAILDMVRPASPRMQQFQQWYLQTWVVPAARDLGLEAEYAYIAPSIARFPKGPQQRQLALEAGFAQAVHYPLLGGLMGVLVLEKAAAA